ncbi:LPS-assembly protein [Poseidonocella sedimentorum]|uniref:LPS-assembly protein LptD n=2 Tax=Poseidonocella sedimentorum TaxID=871652 RepID=A0A1I6DZQ6_9RHOB|nr:LPS-assembly protein [Poseidonocella sedimentorum]
MRPIHLGWLLLLPLLATALWPAALQAQSPGTAVLVADRVFVDAGERLVAEGNVEAFHEGTRLRAERIIYDQTTERLEITGPMRIDDASGATLLADSATMDPDFRDGLMRGARLVLDQQLQLAAVELNRVDGRYTQLSKVTASSCRICAGAGPPIWEIRATRVIHDQTERQIFFDNARLRLLGVPIVWLPRLRLPDPTLTRASGFLVPSIRSSSTIGTGLRLPYFFRLGDHADLTLTPFLTHETRTLEWRFRQAFVHGDITLEGAVSRDDIQPGKPRAYLFGEGQFDLPRDFTLSFDMETTTDDTYLLDHGYSSRDRLDSSLTLTRTRNLDHVDATLIHYQTLRDDEANATQPTMVGDLLYDRLFYPDRIGGQARLQLGLHSHYRYSDEDIIGRDVSRANAELGWQRRWTGPAGLRFGLTGQLNIDLFSITEDSSSDDRANTTQPALAAELRWPLVARGGDGVVHFLEPFANLVWSETLGSRLPNEESTRAEFDEGNLLSFSRFPAPDRRDQGLRGAAGLSWQRLSTETGTTSKLSLGRLYRESADDRYSDSSGLSGIASDWLVSAQLETAEGLSVASRAVFDNAFDFAKAETRIAHVSERYSLAATHVLLPRDADEDRDETISELSLTSAWSLGRHWTAELDWRYDVSSERTARASGGLTYENECIAMTLSTSRRYTSTDTLDPSTEFDFLIELRGFGGRTSNRNHLRSCSN